MTHGAVRALSAYNLPKSATPEDEQRRELESTIAEQSTVQQNNLTTFNRVRIGVDVVNQNVLI